MTTMIYLPVILMLAGCAPGAPGHVPVATTPNATPPRWDALAGPARDAIIAHGLGHHVLRHERPTLRTEEEKEHQANIESGVRILQRAGGYPRSRRSEPTRRSAHGRGHSNATWRSGGPEATTARFGRLPSARLRYRLCGAAAPALGPGGADGCPPSARAVRMAARLRHPGPAAA